MTSVLGEQGAEGGGVDLIAVNLDADLLDLLARRAPMPVGDPVLAMLAALAADVDEGLDDLLVASEDDPLARAAAAGTVVPDLPAPRRGHGMRVTTVAVVVGATLSIGGVAAAVTGDPLAPVKGIATAVGIGADKHEGKANARDAAQRARTQLRHGDVAGAQANLDAMKAELLRDDLSTGDRRSIEARIAALEKQVARAVAALGAEQGNANGSDDSEGIDGEGADSANGKVAGASNGKAAGKSQKPADGTDADGKPNATRTAEQGGSGGTGGADDDDSDDASDSTTSNSRPAGADGRQSKPSPSSTSVTSDDPTSSPATATADPSPRSDEGDTSGSESSTGDRDSGAVVSKDAKGAAGAR